MERLIIWLVFVFVVLALCFLIVITPLGVETLPNALLAFGLVYLATKEFPISFWELVQAKLHHRLPRAVG